MFQRRQVALLRKVVNGSRGSRRESYHSFPDPAEKPQITSVTANFKKTYDKQLERGFTVDARFRLDREFAGVLKSTSISSQERPETLSKKLSNGVTVASQDTPGMMTTISFLLRTGRYFRDA